MKSRLFVLGMALCVAVFVVACGSSGPAGVVKNFVSYVEKGDADSAVNLFSSKTPKETKDKMKTGLALGKDELKKKGGVKSVDIEKEDVKGDTAEVKYKIAYNNGSEDKNQTMKLVKENGEWKKDTEMPARP